MASDGDKASEKHPEKQDILVRWLLLAVVLPPTGFFLVAMALCVYFGVLSNPIVSIGMGLLALAIGGAVVYLTIRIAFD